MSRDELARECIRAQETDDGLHLEVKAINWDGPHTPVSAWHEVPARKGESAEEAVERLLNTRKWFRTCADCGELNPVGWIIALDDVGDVCHRCAVQNHDVVF